MNKRKVALLVSTFVTINTIFFTTANADELDTQKNPTWNDTIENNGSTPIINEVISDEKLEKPIIDGTHEIRTINVHGKDAIQVKFTLTSDVDLSKYTLTVASETKAKYTGLWWKNFLVNAETNIKYGLSGIIPAGTYLTDFTLDQLDLNDSYEIFKVTLTDKASKEVVAEEIFTAEHPFATGTEEDFGPEGDVMPELNPDEFPAQEGLGPNGNVTPELDGPVLDGSADDNFLVDLPAEEDFGPEGDVTPTVTPDNSIIETLPQTGGIANNMIITLGVIFTSAGTILLKRKNK